MSPLYPLGPIETIDDKKEEKKEESGNKIIKPSKTAVSSSEYRFVRDRSSSGKIPLRNLQKTPKPFTLPAGPIRERTSLTSFTEPASGQIFSQQKTASNNGEQIEESADHTVYQPCNSPVDHTKSHTYKEVEVCLDSDRTNILGNRPYSNIDIEMDEYEKLLEVFDGADSVLPESLVEDDEIDMEEYDRLFELMQNPGSFHGRVDDLEQTKRESEERINAFFRDLDKSKR